MQGFLFPYLFVVGLVCCVWCMFICLFVLGGGSCIYLGRKSRYLTNDINHLVLRCTDFPEDCCESNLTGSHISTNEEQSTCPADLVSDIAVKHKSS